MTRQIVLSAGRVALVDDEDYIWLSRWKWSFNGQYAARREDNHSIYMHREILGAVNGAITDHINGEKLDNRKANLRICTPKQNSQNKRKYAQDTTSSQYKGVCFHIKRGLWEARIRADDKKAFLGNFNTEIEAAQAYDMAARESFGEFALLNFPHESLIPNAVIQRTEKKARRQELRRRLRDGEPPKLLAIEFGRPITSLVSIRSQIRTGAIKVDG